ncbi:MAG TPA: type II CAAX endopeptidase family protein [Actinomycetota bacterium]|nr:type II CAAX endopeptidase family protein [Actinomycetota bacterium]
MQEALEPTIPPPPTGVPWRGRDLFYTLVGGLLLSVLLVIVVGIVAFSSDGGEPTYAHYGQFGIAIYVALGLAGWYFAIKRRGASIREAGFRSVSIGTLFKMIPITFGMMILNGILISISAALFGDVPTAQDQVVGDATSIPLDEFVWLFALAAVVAPVAEEFLFRGLLYPLLRDKAKVAFAVAVSALAFALLHFIPPLIPVFLAMGVVFALVVERYKSVYPAMLVHGLNNGVVMVGLYAAIGSG